MPDMTAIAGAASALQTAGEMIKAMIGLRDAAAFQTKAIELQGQIMTAQGHALTAQSEQFALLHRVRDLEEEIRRIKAWETEKDRYELHERATGIFTRRVKPSMQGAEPVHEICATCYEQQRKSPLQLQRADRRTNELFCPSCKTRLSFFPA